MRAKALLQEVRLNDGSTIGVPAQGVVLIVGPNNSGKSQILRDIYSRFTNGPESGVVVSNAQTDYVGSQEDLRRTVEADRSVSHPGGGLSHVRLGNGGMHPLNQFLSFWPHNAHVIGAYFVPLASTDVRLAVSEPVPALDLYSGTPTAALHELYLSPETEQRLKHISEEAFGVGVLLDVWAGGGSWSLRMGDLEPPLTPRPTQEYMDELRRLPLLRSQGDGVRSMLGLLVGVFTGHQTITMVDEPEAFLHPPQARFLGKILAEDAEATNRQVLLSTHSTDIVHGVLEGNAPTTVVRITRSGDRNSAAVLDNDSVRSLWADPLSRYSNLLEGLFSDAAIVCESDADCKFYAAVYDSLETEGGRRLDLLFTSSGGKYRLHSAASTLRAVGVPVAVIADFDVLNDWSVISRLVVAQGGDLANFEPMWRVLNSALTAGDRNPTVAGMQAAVVEAVNRMTEISKLELERVRSVLKVENGWARVKNSGLSAVPNGQAHEACVALLAALAAIGIHVVPLGEMEDFIPAVGGHGPAWLADVLEQHRVTAAEGDTARTLFREVLRSVSPG